MAAQSVTESIRNFINIVNEGLEEAKKPAAPAAPFGVVKGPHFEESLKKHLAVFPDLKEKLARFLDIKLADPLHARYGKHDSPFTPGTPLAGYMHCHLRDDAILVYTMKNRNINLLLVCNHAEIEGKRQVRTRALLAA